MYYSTIYKSIGTPKYTANAFPKPQVCVHSTVKSNIIVKPKHQILPQQFPPYNSLNFCRTLFLLSIKHTIERESKATSPALLVVEQQIESPAQYTQKTNEFPLFGARSSKGLHTVRKMRGFNAHVRPGIVLIRKELRQPRNRQTESEGLSH